MTNNYFKFVPKSKISVEFVFFDDVSPKLAEEAFARVFRYLSRQEGRFSVFRMPDYQGSWLRYVKEVGE